jgi:hypothetical protein
MFFDAWKPSDLSDMILRSISPTQVHMDGVLRRCAQVCKTWHSTVKRMKRVNEDDWCIPYNSSADTYCIVLPVQWSMLQDLHAHAQLLYALGTAPTAASTIFGRALIDVTQAYETTVTSAIEGMQMHQLRRDVQLLGIRLLIQMVCFEDLELLSGGPRPYDNKALFASLENMILPVMRTHLDLAMQVACMKLLNKMEWTGVHSDRKLWRTATSLCLKAVAANLESAELQEHGCNILGRQGSAMGLHQEFNTLCTQAVLTALQMHPTHQGILYASFNALVLLYWAHDHDTPVLGVNLILAGIQSQVSLVQNDSKFNLDPSNMEVHRHASAAKIMFAGLDLLCELLYIDQYAFEGGVKTSYTETLFTAKNFGVTHTALSILNSMGDSIKPWDFFSEHSAAYEKLLWPEKLLSSQTVACIQ